VNRLLRLLITVAPLLVLWGCAKRYETTALKSWDLMSDQRQDQALSLYESEVKRPQDQLLRLMDEGILLRTQGRFQESNQRLMMAAQIVEQNGYVSLSEEGVRLLSDENQTTYQGEDFEKVLIHLYLGLNFLSLNQEDAALVETRKVNEILYRMISEGKRPYELNPFARYVGAMLFENEGEVNDAFIAYKQAYEMSPMTFKSFESLGIDLIRTAKRMKFSEQIDQLEKVWGRPVVTEAEAFVQERRGAVALLLEVGKSPKKISEMEKRQRKSESGSLADVIIPLPAYQRRYYKIQSARLKVISAGGEQTDSQTIYDIEDSAEKFLADRRARLIARALLAAGVKVGVATAIGKASDSKDLGVLAGFLLLATAQADTRSWLLLPGKLQVAKLFLKPGVYQLRVDYLTAKGSVAQSEELSQIKVEPFKTTLIQRRVFR